MTQVTEAVYADGVLKPEGEVSLRANERVRLIILSLEPLEEDGRDIAITELQAAIGRSRFRSTGPLPGRDDLHERR